MVDVDIVTSHDEDITAGPNMESVWVEPGRYKAVLMRFCELCEINFKQIY